MFPGICLQLAAGLQDFSASAIAAALSSAALVSAANNSQGLAAKKSPLSSTISSGLQLVAEPSAVVTPSGFSCSSNLHRYTPAWLRQAVSPPNNPSTQFSLTLQVNPARNDALAAAASAAAAMRSAMLAAFLANIASQISYETSSCTFPTITFCTSLQAELPIVKSKPDTEVSSWYGWSALEMWVVPTIQYILSSPSTAKNSGPAGVKPVISSTQPP